MTENQAMIERLTSKLNLRDVIAHLVEHYETISNWARSEGDSVTASKHAEDAEFLDVVLSSIDDAEIPEEPEACPECGFTGIGEEERETHDSMSGPQYFVAAFCKRCHKVWVPERER